MSMRSLLAEAVYPSSDGKPMAETPLHMRVMIDLIETLIGWFAGDTMVYVWGNMFLYYVEGDPSKNVAPDVFVVKGVPKDKPRDTFKVWEEGKTPNAIIEITSKHTRKEDTEKKFEIYQNVLKVEEYFLFDPRGDYLSPPLQGYRLKKGKYHPIREVDGRLPSQVLNLHLERHDWELRLYNPADGKWLPTPVEAREAAEGEVERLRRELDALRRQSPGS